jgi:hypothetical protein
MAWSKMVESLVSSAVQHASTVGFQEEGDVTGIFLELMMMLVNRGVRSSKVGMCAKKGI